MDRTTVVQLLQQHSASHCGFWLIAALATAETRKLECFPAEDSSSSGSESDKALHRIECRVEADVSGKRQAAQNPHRRQKSYLLCDFCGPNQSKLGAKLTQSNLVDRLSGPKSQTSQAKKSMVVHSPITLKSAVMLPTW